MKYLKKPWIIGLILVSAGLLTGFFIFGGGGNDFELITAQKKDLIEIIEVTGRVKPSHDVNLAFQKSGRVAVANFSVGDKVFAGSTLVSLENGDILSDLNQAKANLKAEIATLKELRGGPRMEEIRIQETKVLNAETSLQDAKRNLVDKINDAYTKSDDAVFNKVDQLFSNPRGSNPQLNFHISNNQLEIDFEFQRFTIGDLLMDWQENLSGLNTGSDLEAYSDQVEDNLDEIKTFLDKASLVVNGLEPNSGLTQTTIDGYKTDIFTARNNISSAVSSLTAALEKKRTAESNLAVERQELDLDLAGGSPEEITIQEAKVDAARASVDRWQAELLKTIIRAPITGVITKMEAKVGEIAPANNTLITLISQSDFEVEANIPEADIANLAIGQEADISLDAYDDSINFKAKVTSIDPAETVIEGVSTYKTTLQFIEKDERIKSGMTADIDIVTARREGVYAIPRRVLLEDEGDRYVQILDSNGEVKKVEVKTGITGSEGEIEIISGIEEGDRIVTNFFNE